MINEGQSNVITVQAEVILPEKLEVYVKPGGWHAIKIIITRFVVFLIPLIILARYILREIYEQDVFKTTKIVDIPTSYIQTLLKKHK